MRHRTHASTDLPNTGPKARIFDSGDHPARARVLVDRTGQITAASTGARALLGYRGTAGLDPCFFAHIHSRNRLQIMRDVAAMVRYGRSSAKWIVRMRTADRNWIWLRLVAKRVPLGGPAGAWIAVDLQRMGA